MHISKFSKCLMSIVSSYKLQIRADLCLGWYTAYHTRRSSQSQSKMIHVKFVILNSHVRFKTFQKHLFLWGKTDKLEMAVFSIICTWIWNTDFSSKKTANIMTTKKRYQQKVLSKIIMCMIILIMYIIITHMNLVFKFILCQKKKPYRYYGFLIAIYSLWYILCVMMFLT